jgi:hypothetical protein
MRVPGHLSPAAGLALALLAGVPVAGCSSSPAPATAPPAVLSTAGPDGVRTVTLTSRAVQRLAVTSAPVAGSPGGPPTVPYAAVVYAGDGSGWVFIDLGRRSYRRVKVVVAGVVGDRAGLAVGPAVGTPVVTVGAAELLGVELGISAAQ